MAAPAIPPTRPGLIGTGPAVGVPHRLASRGLADRRVVTASAVGEDVLGEKSTSMTRSSPETTTPTSFRDNGHRAELVDFADAVPFEVRPFGSIARSAADAMIVQRPLDPAQRAAVPVLDPVPGKGPVPLWQPRRSTGLFNVLPGQHICSSASFAA
jgi:hypothetical protein